MPALFDNHWANTRQDGEHGERRVNQVPQLFFHLGAPRRLMHKV